MKAAFWISLAIAVIGGVNWALYGLIGVDAVELLFGPYTVAARAVYVVVGFASLALLAISGAYVAVIEPQVTEVKKERAPRAKRAPRIGRRAKAARAAA